MNAEYRRQIAKWTREAMVRKAQAGHVTGGRCSATNVRIDGHIERRINEAQAAVIRRIFELYAGGTATRASPSSSTRSARRRRARSGRPAAGARRR